MVAQLCEYTKNIELFVVSESYKVVNNLTKLFKR